MLKTFTIDVQGSIELTVDEIWPDGDAPENPTADDVVEVLQTTLRSPSELLREWNLDDQVTVSVRGVDVEW